MANGWIPEAQRNAIYKRDRMICAYCGTKCVSATVKGMTRKEQTDYMRSHKGSFATLDHIISRESVKLVYGADSTEYRDMLTDPRNLLTVCSSCNSSKKHNELYTWAKGKGFNTRNIRRRIESRVKKVSA